MSWSIPAANSEILAIHAAYLGATNEIIYFGGDQHNPDNSANGRVDATRLYDVASGAVTRVRSPKGDVFCCGHALLADDDRPREGRLLVAGGTYKFNEVVPGPHHDHFPGIRESSVWHPADRAWTNAALLNPGVVGEPCSNPDMPTGGRWYPTLLTLPDGAVLASQGHPGECDRYHDNFIPEVYTDAPRPTGAWHQLGSYRVTADVDKFQARTTTYYPRLFVLPTGDVLSASPVGTETFSMSITRSPWGASFHPVADFKTVIGLDPHGLYGGYNATAVLLPLVPRRDAATGTDIYDARVLIAGAARSFILDLRGWNPSAPVPPGTYPQAWKETAPRQLAGAPRRVNCNAVMLPTGEVLICGGVQGIERINASGQPYVAEVPDTTAVLQPEIFNPWTNTWSAPNDPATVVRNYHSVALLMGDGAVWTAGSDKDAGRGDAARELRFEIYYPWYYGNPDRPFIDQAPDRVLPGEQWPLKTAQGSRIRRVAMVRCGSSTHSFDGDQRYIDLRFDHAGPDMLRVTFPPSNNVMIPGFYFLYVINDAGLPSSGTVVYATPARR